jgi:hypothetical protein
LLERGSARISTLDLMGGRFVLLAGSAGQAWCTAARAAASEHGIALEALRVADGGELDDPDGAWRNLWEIDGDGAVLVRPDGQVAWRSRGARPDAEAELGRVLRRVLSR